MNEQSLSTTIQYNIEFILGMDIHDLHTDCITLFESFSLLSWLNTEYRVRILALRTSSDGIQYYVAKASKNRYQQIQTIGLYLYVVEKSPTKLLYTYYIQEQESPLKKQNRIVAQFIRLPDRVQLVIKDEQGFFEGILSQSEKERFSDKKRFKKRGDNILEYRYIEPQDIRHRYERSIDHFHLAFQGGGAKGVAYIGAYKAIKDLYPNAMIRSIIGSSAGGMIALAVSAGASTDELIDICKCMDQIPKDRTIKTIEDLTPEKIQYYNTIKARLRQLLHDHGILQNKMYDLLADQVFDDEVIDKLFDVLTGDNESLKVMFSLQKEEPCPVKKWSLFRKKSVVVQKRRKLINYYGMLGGNLLNGEEVINICKVILGKLIVNTFNNNRQVFFQTIGVRANHVMTMNQEQAHRISEQLTMRQYYILTRGVEFTCTAVDLEDKILRFLNHKTTPFLPVVKAVQMTSSFPVAFKALAWQPQWGKYYIHYMNTRREIDLTNHQFTDGGMLANFPIKFLDNEQIRPFYFSHAQTDKTHIFGFGLEMLRDEENESMLMRKKALASEELKELIKSKLPIGKLLYIQLFQTPPPKLVDASSINGANQIPLIGFLRKLMQTYLDSSENFVEECFAKRIFFFKETLTMSKYLTMQLDINDKIERYLQLRQAVINLQNNQQSYNYCYLNLYKYLKEDMVNPMTGQVDIESIIYVKSVLIKNLKDYALFRITQKHLIDIANKSPQYQDELDKFQLFFSELLQRMDGVNKAKVFQQTNCLQAEAKQLGSLLDDWHCIYTRAGGKSSQLRQAMHSHFQQFFFFTRIDDLRVIESIISELTIRIGQMQGDPSFVHLKVDHNQLTESISKFAKYFTYKNLPTFGPFLEKLSNLNESNMMQKKNFEESRENIYQFVEKAVTRGRSSKLHLVFQSKGVMGKSYMDAYKLVNQFIFTNQAKKTAYLIQKITSKIIKTNEKCNAKHPFGINDLVKFIIIRSDLYKYVERNFERLPAVIDLGYVRYSINQDLQATIQDAIEKRQANVNKITNITCASSHALMFFLIAAGFQHDRVLREIYNIKSLIQIDYAQVEREFNQMDWNIPMKSKVRKFQQSLWNTRFDMFATLETQAKSGNLEINMQEIKRRFEDSSDYIMDGFDTVMDYVISSEIAAESRPINMTYEQFMAQRLSIKYGKKDYEKINNAIGQETKKALSIILDQYQSLVRHIVFTYTSEGNRELISLEKDPLRRDAIWKGIIMTNFIQIDGLKRHLFELLEELNLPKDIKLKQFYDVCPVKLDITITAVDISSHVIEFINRHTYPEMPVWAAILTAVAFPSLFRPIRAKAAWCQTIDTNSDKRYLKRFFASESIRKMPVLVSGNLLSNLPLQYITNKKIQELHYDEKQGFTFINFGVKEEARTHKLDGLFQRKFLSTTNAIKLFLMDFSLLETGSFSESRSDLLKSFINGEDNLTLSIYYKELVSLPIRLGTLDFHKFKRPHVLPNIIDETYYYTIEKFCTDNITFFRFLLKQGKIHLQFISKEHNTLDLMREYNITYRTDPFSPYKLMQAHVITLDARVEKLNIRFQYVGEKLLADKVTKKISIFEREFMFQFQQLQLFEYYESLFGFHYSDVINGKLQPIKTPFVVLGSSVRQGLTEVPYVIACKSMIDIDKNGLYCEGCCSPLMVRKNQCIKTGTRDCDKCAKCTRPLGIKYLCSCVYGACQSTYCMRCCRRQAIHKINNRLWCSFGHMLKFQNKTQFILQSEQVRSSRCNLCQAYTESYFFDATCEITICQACSSQFILKS